MIKMKKTLFPVITKLVTMKDTGTSKEVRYEGSIHEAFNIDPNNTSFIIDLIDIKESKFEKQLKSTSIT